MPSSPGYYWRADGGLQEAPKPPPRPRPTMYGWQCAPQYQGQWMCQPWQQWQCPPGYMPGPIYINGVGTPPPEYGELSPPPPECDKGVPPPPAAPKEESEKKENRDRPPKMPGGCNYMFDKNTTMIHVFSKTSPIWEDKYKDAKKKFRMFKVSMNFTVKMVIENVLRQEGDPCKGWAATEVVEIGGGKWAKGSTIEYDSDKSDGKLKEMSWSAKRGSQLPPVWLVIHKV